MTASPALARGPTPSQASQTIGRQHGAERHDHVYGHAGRYLEWHASGNLSDPANWVGGVAPSPAADVLALGSSTASSPVNDFPAGSEFNSLTLNGNCTLSGNSVLLDSTISNTQGNNSLALPLVFGDDGLFQVSSGSLAVDGPIDNGGNLLTVNTAASTTATIVGAISGSGGLVKSDTGTLVLTGPNSYSGSTEVQAGTLASRRPRPLCPAAH